MQDQEPTVGKGWLDPMWASNQLAGAVDFAKLEFDPETCRYLLAGAPFTGVCVTWWALDFVDGYANGVSVAWHHNGHPEVYNEMVDDVCDGWHIRWHPDGTLKEKFRYSLGRQIG